MNITVVTQVSKLNVTYQKLSKILSNANINKDLFKKNASSYLLTTEMNTQKNALPKKRSRQHVRLTYLENNPDTNSCSIKTQNQPADFRRIKKHTCNKPVNVSSSFSFSDQPNILEPELWREHLANIVEMRRQRDAPVDTMGCDVIADRQACPKVYRYQILISLMLSSQTKDEVTSAALLRLKGHGCNISNILSTSDDLLGKLIYPVGFWKKKVSYIKRTSHILKDRYESDIPNTPELLCQLPGVGPKMAHLVMKTAWNMTTGIAVDTHVHRICNRLGWVSTSQPEKTRQALEEWLPREHWNKINLLLVGFGQQICNSLVTKCHLCLNRYTCPFFGTSGTARKRKY